MSTRRRPRQPPEPPGEPGAPVSSSVRARLVRTLSAMYATPAAIRPLSRASDIVTSVSAAAAAKPTAPNATMTRVAAAPWRRATRPTPAATISATATMNRLRASLSLVPNRLTMKSLAPGGCRAMTCVPTAITSDGKPGRSPAASSLAAMPAAPAATPARAHERWVSSSESLGAGRDLLTLPI